MIGASSSLSRITINQKTNQVAAPPPNLLCVRYGTSGLYEKLSISIIGVPINHHRAGK